MTLTKAMAFIGWVVVVLSLLGAFDIGDFRLTYGPNGKYKCSEQMK